MDTVIALIGMIDATRASFGSDAYGSWISCVGLAPLPPWFTVYRSRRHRLDGASLCAFKMCQGERVIAALRRRLDEMKHMVAAGSQLADAELRHLLTEALWRLAVVEGQEVQRWV
jgi:hypothetical protein